MLRLFLNYVSKNIPRFYILSNSAKNEPMLIIFGVQNPDEISHEKVVNSSTSPESCRHTVL